jgi:acetyl esterase/lipase
MTMNGSTDRKTRGLLYREGVASDAYSAERCRLDVYVPEGFDGFATVVWFHGGGLNSGNRHVPDGFREQGFAVVSADYRLSPRATAPAYIDDAAAAVAWTFHHIAEYGGNPKRIVVAGASAGAYLASLITLDPRWLATYDVDARNIAGLVSLTGQMITHFTIRQERGLSPFCAQVDDLAPFYHVSADAPPTLLVTGDREHELFGRYEENAYFQRMMKLAGHAHIELIELPGLDHGAVEPAAVPHAVRFIHELFPLQR